MQRAGEQSLEDDRARATPTTASRRGLFASATIALATRSGEITGRKALGARPVKFPACPKIGVSTEPGETVQAWTSGKSRSSIRSYSVSPRTANFVMT